MSEWVGEWVSGWVGECAMQIGGRCMLLKLANSFPMEDVYFACLKTISLQPNQSPSFVPSLE